VSAFSRIIEGRIPVRGYQLEYSSNPNSYGHVKQREPPDMRFGHAMMSDVLHWGPSQYGYGDTVLCLNEFCQHYPAFPLVGKNQIRPYQKVPKQFYELNSIACPDRSWTYVEDPANFGPVVDTTLPYYEPALTTRFFASPPIINTFAYDAKTNSLIGCLGSGGVATGLFNAEGYYSHSADGATSNELTGLLKSDEGVSPKSPYNEMYNYVPYLDIRGMAGRRVATKRGEHDVVPMDCSL